MWHIIESKKILFNLLFGEFFMGKIRCSKPPISSYDFMRYLCASLVQKSKLVIDMDSIIPKIYDFKQNNPNLIYLFEDIEFRRNIDSVVSSDISEGLNYLQTFGLVGKLNPKYEKLVIYLSINEANQILSECNAEVSGSMETLAELF